MQSLSQNVLNNIYRNISIKANVFLQKNVWKGITVTNKTPLNANM